MSAAKKLKKKITITCLRGPDRSMAVQIHWREGGFDDDGDVSVLLSYGEPPGMNRWASETCTSPFWWMEGFDWPSEPLPGKEGSTLDVVHTPFGMG